MTAYETVFFTEDNRLKEKHKDFLSLMLKHGGRMTYNDIEAITGTRSIETLQILEKLEKCGYMRRSDEKRDVAQVSYNYKWNIFTIKKVKVKDPPTKEVPDGQLEL